MKKTEKIEIRISPEDKEALGRRAEAEGRPVSEVVRDLLQANGATLAPMSASAEPAAPKIVAACLLGALLGASGAWLAASSREPAEEAFLRVSTQLWTDQHTPFDATAVVPAGELNGLRMVVPTRAGDYRVDFAADPANASAYRVRAVICRVEGDDCTALATPSLDTSLTSRSTMEAAWGEAEAASIFLEGYTVAR